MAHTPRCSDYKQIVLESDTGASLGSAGIVRFHNIRVPRRLRTSGVRIKMAPPEPAGAAAVTKEPRIFASKLKEKGSRCCVVLCNNRWGKDKELGVKRSYHSFPADPKRLQQWVKAIPRTDWVPNKSSKICSDHFTGGRF